MATRSRMIRRPNRPESVGFGGSSGLSVVEGMMEGRRRKRIRKRRKKQRAFRNAIRKARAQNDRLSARAQAVHARADLAEQRRETRNRDRRVDEIGEIAAENTPLESPEAEGLARSGVNPLRVGETLMQIENEELQRSENVLSLDEARRENRRTERIDRLAKDPLVRGVVNSAFSGGLEVEDRSEANRTELSTQVINEGLSERGADFEVREEDVQRLRERFGFEGEPPDQSTSAAPSIPTEVSGESQASAELTVRQMARDLMDPETDASGVCGGAVQGMASALRCLEGRANEASLMDRALSRKPDDVSEDQWSRLFREEVRSQLSDELD